MRRWRSRTVLAVILATGGVLGCRHPSARADLRQRTASPGGVGLILGADEGERRVRRNVGKGPFILKVDRQNGGSPDLVMGYEDIAPGAEIQPHTHLVADEILFIHRGSGIARLGERESAVSSGSTIYPAQRADQRSQHRTRTARRRIHLLETRIRRADARQLGSGRTARHTDVRGRTRRNPQATQLAHDLSAAAVR